MPTVDGSETAFPLKEKQFRALAVRLLQDYAHAWRSSISVENATAIYSVTRIALSLSWQRHLLNPISSEHTIHPKFKLQLIQITLVVLECDLTSKVTLQQHFLDQIERCER